MPKIKRNVKLYKKLFNGKIYKITSDYTDDVYIGSTYRKLDERLKEHDKKYKLYLKDNNNDYLTSFKILKYDTYEISLIELVNVNTKKELTDREGHHIRITPNCINKIINGRTEKEWRIDNKAYLKEYHTKYIKNNKIELSKYHKQYRTEHKDEIKIKQKKYHENNKDTNNLKKKQKEDCECGHQYTLGHKTRHLQTEKHKKYANNPEELKEKQKNKIPCVCGSSYSLPNKGQHLKTIKHKSYLDNL